MQPIEQAYKTNVPVQYLGYETNEINIQSPKVILDGKELPPYWQPQASVNNKLLEKEGINANWKYRKFMTENALKIMKYNTENTLSG
jgi:hypothetical protein